MSLIPRSTTRPTLHHPNPEFPTTSMTGKAMTVAGPVEPDQLGFTLMHERLYLDLHKNH